MTATTREYPCGCAHRHDDEARTFEATAKCAGHDNRRFLTRPARTPVTEGWERALIATLPARQRNPEPRERTPRRTR